MYVCVCDSISRLNDIEHSINLQGKESEGPKNWPPHYPEIKGGKKGDVYKLVSRLSYCVY